MENNNNSLQKEISELQELCKRMEDMEMNESWFNPPATEEKISNWEQTNNITIPESYKEWLRFSDGSLIFSSTARFLGVNEIVINEKYTPEDLVIIGHLIGDGEMLCFSKMDGKIVRLFEGKRKEFDSFRSILFEVIRLGKSEFGEDEISKEVTAKLLAMLEEENGGR